MLNARTEPHTMQLNLKQVHTSSTAGVKSLTNLSRCYPLLTSTLLLHPPPLPDTPPQQPVLPTTAPIHLACNIVDGRYNFTQDLLRINACCPCSRADQLPLPSLIPSRTASLGAPYIQFVNILNVSLTASTWALELLCRYLEFKRSTTSKNSLTHKVLKDYFTHHSGCCHTDHHSIAEKIIHHFE